MSFPRFVPATAALVATLVAALPAAAHSIGILHDHAALDGSLIVAALAALAGLGLWYAKGRG